MSRDESTRLLSGPNIEVGTFIIRNSSHQGEYSLSVKESNEEPAVRHYLIQVHKNPEDNSLSYRIADNSFVGIPMLLNHYKMYLLDKTSLTSPYKREEIERVVALYRFEGDRETDLNFEAGEELVIIEKKSEWWQARNALGITGIIPANYVTSINDHDRHLKGRSQSSYGSLNGEERYSNASSNSEGDDNKFEPSLPAQAKVILDRQPNAYDATQLKIRKGQLITVIKKMDNGQYEAKLNGKTGYVPFTYIRF